MNIESKNGQCGVIVAQVRTALKKSHEMHVTRPWLGPRVETLRDTG